MQKRKRSKKGKHIKIILYLFSLIILTVINTMFIINIIKLKEIETLIRIILCVVMLIINIYFILRGILYIFKHTKTKVILHIIIMLVISLIVGFINFNFNKIYGVLDDVTKKYESYTLSIVTISDNKVNNIKKIDGDIAVIEDENITNGYTFAKNIIKKNNVKYNLVKYEDYTSIVKALYDGEIKYAFLPDNYGLMFSSMEEYADIETKLKVIHKDSVDVKVESVNKDVNKPFSILLMGVDTLTTSFNADTLLVVTFNPETLSATMLSIPRDTYTKIACTGGKHKINSSGWYSDKCVMDTVSNLLDIDIDYYVKINFVGIVDLVEALGGIDVDVVYPFCEQNSKRQFGEHLIYVEEGMQHLNGEQALALSRNRKFLTGQCPAKYNSKGYYSSNLRNDITRGLNQQLVMKGILNALSEVNDLNTIYGLLDTIGNNVTTNMDKDTMLSFYNVFKNIIIKSNKANIDETLTIQKLSLSVYITYVNVNKLNLSMVIAHQNSINAVSNAMKINLGLKEKETIKTLEFNVNKPYEEKVIGSGITGGTSLRKMNNLVGKTKKETEEYCSSKNLVCEFTYVDKEDSSLKNDQVLSQSIPENYDLDVLGSKVITFEIAKITAPKPFNYSLCIKEEYKNDNICQIPNFTNKNISELNKWYQNFGYITLKRNETSDIEKENGIIISQDIYGKSIYELYNDSKTITITYINNEVQNEETEEPNPEKPEVEEENNE